MRSKLYISVCAIGLGVMTAVTPVPPVPPAQATVPIIGIDQLPTTLANLATMVMQDGIFANLLGIGWGASLSLGPIGMITQAAFLTAIGVDSWFCQVGAWQHWTTVCGKEEKTDIQGWTDNTQKSEDPSWGGGNGADTGDGIGENWGSSTENGNGSFGNGTGSGGAGGGSFGGSGASGGGVGGGSGAGGSGGNAATAAALARSTAVGVQTAAFSETQKSSEKQIQEAQDLHTALQAWTRMDRNLLLQEIRFFSMVASQSNMQAVTGAENQGDITKNQAEPKGDK